MMTSRAPVSRAPPATERKTQKTNNGGLLVRFSPHPTTTVVRRRVFVQVVATTVVSIG